MPNFKNLVVHTVHGTSCNETMWKVSLCETSTNIKSIRQRLIKHSTLIKYGMLNENTRYIVDKVSCRSRYKVGEEFRLVQWSGFKTPTREPVSFTAK